jgi:hypothetical protein
MSKRKFNKKKCRQCVYHASLSSGGTIICSFATRNLNDDTCLYKGDDGKIHDRRGEDYEHCLLYIKGAPYKTREIY